jgi:hypothetical protein
MALRRPFLYFLFEHHCEQMIDVAGRLQRHRVEVMMRFPIITLEILAKVIRENMRKSVDCSDGPLDGARKSAEIMAIYLT